MIRAIRRPSAVLVVSVIELPCGRRKKQVALSAALAATAVNVVSLWCLLRAYHLRLSPLDAAAVFAIITIGTFLPNAPGNLGPWQFFCVVGLQLFGSRRSSRGFQLGGLLPLDYPPILMGFCALHPQSQCLPLDLRGRARALSPACR